MRRLPKQKDFIVFLPFGALVGLGYLEFCCWHQIKKSLTLTDESWGCIYWGLVICFHLSRFFQGRLVAYGSLTFYSILFGMCSLLMVWSSGVSVLLICSSLLRCLISYSHQSSICFPWYLLGDCYWIWRTMVALSLTLCSQGLGIMCRCYSFGTGGHWTVLLFIVI